MPGLAGTRKDKKYSSLSLKLHVELKGLVKPEHAPSTPSTLHLRRLDISFQCIEELAVVFVVFFVIFPIVSWSNSELRASLAP